MKYGICHLNYANNKMQDASSSDSSDDGGFYVVPSNVSDDESDIEIINIETSQYESRRESHSLIEDPCEYEPSVFFHDMLDVYPVDSDIVARVSFSDGYEKTPEDKVVLVQMGWRSVDQALCVAEIEGQYVKFDSRTLPKTPTEFYQLCYSSTGKAVPGVSGVFSFREVQESERMIVSDLGPTESRISHLMKFFWNSVVENQKKINEQKILPPVNSMPNLEGDRAAENSSSAKDEKNLEVKEIPQTEQKKEEPIEPQVEQRKEEPFEPQVSTAEIEEQPSQKEINRNRFRRLMQEKIIETLNAPNKHEECESLKKHINQIETELSQTQEFLEYMITQKDERFRQMSDEEKNAHTHVYETRKSQYRKSQRTLTGPLGASSVTGAEQSHSAENGSPSSSHTTSSTSANFREEASLVEYGYENEDHRKEHYALLKNLRIWFQNESLDGAEEIRKELRGAYLQIARMNAHLVDDFQRLKAQYDHLEGSYDLIKGEVSALEYKLASKINEKIELVKRIKTNSVRNDNSTIELEKQKKLYNDSITKIKEAYERKIEDITLKMEEKEQEYASQLVCSKFRNDKFEKDLKNLRDDYELRLKKGAKEYAKLSFKYQKLQKTLEEDTASQSSTTSNYLTDLRARIMKNVKVKPRREDQK